MELMDCNGIEISITSFENAKQTELTAGKRNMNKDLGGIFFSFLEFHTFLTIRLC